jgi:hypothetical protein
MTRHYPNVGIDSIVGGDYIKWGDRAHRVEPSIGIVIGLTARIGLPPKGEGDASPARTDGPQLVPDLHLGLGIWVDLEDDVKAPGRGRKRPRSKEYTCPKGRALTETRLLRNGSSTR